jgi:hypothetical protein
MSERIDLTALPATILADIRKRAKVEWPDDNEWQEDFVRDEATGYMAFHSIDFAGAAPVKDTIIAEAMEFYPSWEERASHVADEIKAIAQIAATAPEDIPANVLEEMKQAVAAEGDWFSVQRDSLRRAIDGYRYVRDIREKVGPIRDLLVRMEGIIGQECYNGNIQNYSSWASGKAKGAHSAIPLRSSVTAKKRKDGRTQPTLSMRNW